MRSCKGCAKNISDRPLTFDYCSDSCRVSTLNERNRNNEERKKRKEAYQHEWRRANPAYTAWRKENLDRNKERIRELQLVRNARFIRRHPCPVCGERYLGKSAHQLCVICLNFAQWVSGVPGFTAEESIALGVQFTKEEREKYQCIRTEKQEQRFRKQLITKLRNLKPNENSAETENHTSS